jgi:antitoxin (DNA-binding transcriptional repressor) of toxin-antitoxin stability system
MITVNIHEKDTHLDELLRLLETTKEILLTDENTPIARLISVEPTLPSRIPGLGIGTIWVSDDFDDPLPDEFWLGEE